MKKIVLFIILNFLILNSIIFATDFYKTEVDYETSDCMDPDYTFEKNGIYKHTSVYCEEGVGYRGDHCLNDNILMEQKISGGHRATAYADCSKQGDARKYCDDGKCVLCLPDETRECKNNNEVHFCTDNYKFEKAYTCDSRMGFLGCEDGYCVKNNCSSKANAGEYFCSGKKSYQCRLTNSEPGSLIEEAGIEKFYIGLLADDCENSLPIRYCYNGICADCENTWEKKCVDDVLEGCNKDHLWETLTDCSQLDLQCFNPIDTDEDPRCVECKPDAIKCEDDTLFNCSTKLKWSEINGCNFGCGEDDCLKPIIKMEEEKSSVEFEKIVGGVDINIDIPDETINKGIIRLNKDIKNAILNIKEMDIDEVPSGKVYKYYNISLKSENVPSYELNFTLYFNVEKDWIEKNEVPIDTIKLQKYDKSWRFVPTKMVEETNKTIIFTSNISKFYTFAITGQIGPIITLNQMETLRAVKMGSENKLSIEVKSDFGMKKATFKINNGIEWKDICKENVDHPLENEAIKFNCKWKNEDIEEGIKVEWKVVLEDVNDNILETNSRYFWTWPEPCPACSPESEWTDCIDNSRTKVYYECLTDECTEEEGCSCIEKIEKSDCKEDITIKEVQILIRNANNEILKAKNEGKNTSLAEEKLEEARSKLILSNKKESKELANEAYQLALNSVVVNTEEDYTSIILGIFIIVILVLSIITYIERKKIKKIINKYLKKQDKTKKKQQKIKDNLIKKCYICGDELKARYKCSVCNRNVCFNHARTYQGKITCIRCLRKMGLV